MAKIVDANLILRFLLKDNEIQARAVKNLLEREKLVLTDVVVAEAIWVLQSVYKLDKDQIIEKLYDLLNREAFVFDYQLLMNSLLLFLNNNISFIDAYLISYCEQKKLEGIYSFDGGLDKVKIVKRFKP